MKTGSKLREGGRRGLHILKWKKPQILDEIKLLFFLDKNRKWTKIGRKQIGRIQVMDESKLDESRVGRKQGWTKTGWTKTGGTKMNWTKSGSTVESTSKNVDRWLFHYKESSLLAIVT